MAYTVCRVSEFHSCALLSGMLSKNGRSSPKDFTWQGTWRSTYLEQPMSKEPKVDCSDLFSDVLHRPFFCAHVSLDHYAANIPRHNQITRLSNLTPNEFEAQWVNRPFILTSPVKEWPV